MAYKDLNDFMAKLAASMDQKYEFLTVLEDYTKAAVKNVQELKDNLNQLCAQGKRALGRVEALARTMRDAAPPQAADLHAIEGDLATIEQCITIGAKEVKDCKAANKGYAETSIVTMIDQHPSEEVKTKGKQRAAIHSQVGDFLNKQVSLLQRVKEYDTRAKQHHAACKKLLVQGTNAVTAEVQECQALADNTEEVCTRLKKGIGACDEANNQVASVMKVKKESFMQGHVNTLKKTKVALEGLTKDVRGAKKTVDELDLQAKVPAALTTLKAYPKATHRALPNLIKRLDDAHKSLGRVMEEWQTWHKDCPGQMAQLEIALRDVGKQVAINEEKLKKGTKK